MVLAERLEEAEIIVVNKIDTVDLSFRQKLVAALKQNFAQAEVREVSCKTEEGLEPLFERLVGGRPRKRQTH